MSLQTFHHVALVCKDPLAVERYYTRHFGFSRGRVIPMSASEQIVFIRSGELYLELFQAKGDAPVAPVGGAGPEYAGWRHLAFKVDDIHAKLAEMGDDARITLGPLSFDDVIPGWRTVWVADPEDNVIEISQGYVDQEQPPPLNTAQGQRD
jgi:glyoxylase I family protein